MPTWLLLAPKHLRVEHLRVEHLPRQMSSN